MMLPAGYRKGLDVCFFFEMLGFNSLQEFQGLENSIYLFHSAGRKLDVPIQFRRVETTKTIVASDHIVV